MSTATPSSGRPASIGASAASMSPPSPETSAARTCGTSAKESRSNWRSSAGNAAVTAGSTKNGSPSATAATRGRRSLSRASGSDSRNSPEGMPVRANSSADRSSWVTGTCDTAHALAVSGLSLTGEGSSLYTR